MVARGCQVTRHGDTCGLCGDAILEREEMVTASAYPWHLLYVEPDTVHRDCANRAMRETLDIQASDEADWLDAISEGATDGNR